MYLINIIGVIINIIYKWDREVCRKKYLKLERLVSATFRNNLRFGNTQGASRAVESSVLLFIQGL